MADDATRDLEKAMPALDAAVDALEKLDKKSIAEAGEKDRVLRWARRDHVFSRQRVFALILMGNP